MRVLAPDDRDTFIQVDFVASVNTSGRFTTTLNKEDVAMIESFGIKLNTNGRANARPGYFESDTYSGLYNDISSVLEQCISRELVEEKTVLRYAFSSSCSFGLTTEGKIIPNLGWSADGKVDNVRGWQSGTIFSHASRPEPLAIKFYIKAAIKRVYKYRSGKEFIHYSYLSPFGGSSFKDEDKYYLSWIEQICSIRPPEGTAVQEIDYTEERAKFFVNMYKKMCELAVSIRELSNSETLLETIETNKLLNF